MDSRRGLPSPRQASQDMSVSPRTALLLVAITSGVIGFLVGRDTATDPRPAEATVAQKSDVPTQRLPEHPESSDEDGQSIARLAVSIDALGARVASLDAALSKWSETLVATRDGHHDGDPEATRDIASPAPAPNDAHLRELETWDTDPTSRRKWLFLSARSAMEHFGIPTRVWTSQGASSEFWDYDLGGGRQRTLVFNSGRLIEVRTTESSATPR